MDKRLEAPDRIWIREDRYGIDLEGAYGAKPKDVDCVEYVRADLARSAPEPAPGEGSPSPSEIEDFQADLWAALLNTSAKITPSHTWEKWMKIKRAIPSGPAQDSQEVREALARLEAYCKALHEQGDYDGHLPWDESTERRDYVLIRDILLSALLSQSPKGAAGPDRALAMETLLVLACKELIRRTGNIESQGCRAWWQGKEEGLEGGGDGEPSAPKTGLRGAGAPGEGATLDAIRPVIEDIEDSARVAAGGFQGQPTYWTFNVFEDIRKKAKALLELLPAKTKPAHGDVEDDDTDHITNNPNVIEARERWEREQAAKGGDVGEAGGAAV